MSLVGYEYPVRLDVCYRIKAILNGLDWLMVDSDSNFEKAEYNYNIRIKKKRRECEVLFARLNNQSEETMNRIDYIINLAEDKLREIYLKKKEENRAINAQRRKAEFYNTGQSLYG